MTATRDAISERRSAETCLGEPVILAQHILHGAAVAEAKGTMGRLGAATLLHDIGQDTSDPGPYLPGGSEDLKNCLPPFIVDCVRPHVVSNGDLWARGPADFDRLSPGSDHALFMQAEPMTAKEVAAFEAEPQFHEPVGHRNRDNGGKDTDMQTPDFIHDLPLPERVGYA